MALVTERRLSCPGEVKQPFSFQRDVEACQREMADEKRGIVSAREQTFLCLALPGRVVELYLRERIEL